MQSIVGNDNLATLLESRASTHFDRPLYSFLDKAGEISINLSYQELFLAARAIAAVLQERSLYKQAIVLIFPHGVDFIVAFFGAVLAGAYPMPMTKPRGKNWQSLETVIRDSGARAIMTVRQTGNTLPLELLSRNNMSIIYTDEVDVAGEREWQRPNIDSSDIAFVQYTSGSTSQPKGVAITHANVIDNSEQIRVNFGNSADDVGIGWLPFFHDMGLIGHVIQPLYTGIHNYFISPVAFVAQPLRWLKAISRYRGSISGGPNFAFDLCTSRVTDDDLVEIDLKSWRIAYCGAERIVPATINTFVHKFAPVGMPASAFYSCYGMAEATLFVSGCWGLQTSQANGKEQEYTRVGTVSGNDIQIVDPSTSKPIIQDGTVGEIWIKSNSVASGYYRNPDDSLKVFDHSIGGGSGYLRSGDLGFLHGDDLYFVGRLKNLLKLHGSSYFAEDIETHICELFARDGVVRCVAFANDHERRETLVVLLEASNQIDCGEWQSVCDRVGTEICQSIGIVPECVLMTSNNGLPLTTSGKTQRQECKRRFLDGVYRRAPEQSTAARVPKTTTGPNHPTKIYRQN